MKIKLYWTLLLALLAAGCTTNLNRGAYRVLGGIGTTENSAVRAWKAHVAEQGASESQVNLVRTAHERFVGALRAAYAARRVYAAAVAAAAAPVETPPGGPPALPGQGESVQNAATKLRQALAAAVLSGETVVEQVRTWLPADKAAKLGKVQR